MTEAGPIARGSAIPAVDFDRLAHWLTTSTDQVFRTLRRETRHVGGQRYAFIDRGADILGVAHLDTVNELTRPDFRDTWCAATGLDDRLGAYIIVDLLPLCEVSCDILLTEDEETGQSSARRFKMPTAYNWIFSFDRRGTDVVLYGYDGGGSDAAKWRSALNRGGFCIDAGSYSCIADLEHLGVKGVNLGAGYYCNHSLQAFVQLDETITQVERFVRFAAAYATHRFPHQAHSRQ